MGFLSEFSKVGFVENYGLRIFELVLIYIVMYHPMLLDTKKVGHEIEFAP